MPDINNDTPMWMRTPAEVASRNTQKILHDAEAKANMNTPEQLRNAEAKVNMHTPEQLQEAAKKELDRLNALPPAEADAAWRELALKDANFYNYVLLEATERSKSADQKQKTEQRKGGHTSDMHNNDPKLQRMISQLEAMNKANEKYGKTVNAEELAQKIYNNFGDKAPELLENALRFPSEYAKAAGDNSIRTSRGAAEHLSNLTGEKANELSDKLLGAKKQEQEQAATPPVTNNEQKQPETVTLESAEQTTDPKQGLQSELAAMSAENNPAYAKLKSAIDNILNGNFENITEDILTVIKALMMHHGYNYEDPYDLQQFARDGLDAMNKIDKKAEKVQEVAAPTQGTAQQTSELSPDEKRHQEDKERYYNLLKENPKKFTKARETFEDTLKNKNATADEIAAAKYNLGVITEVAQETKDALKVKAKEDKSKADKKMEKAAEKALQSAEKAKEESSNSSAFSALQDANGKARNILQQISNAPANLYNNTKNWLEKKKVDVNASQANQTVYTLSGFEGHDATNPQKLTNGIYTVKKDKQGNVTDVMYQANAKSEAVRLNLDNAANEALFGALKEAGKNPQYNSALMQGRSNSNVNA